MSHASATAHRGKQIIDVKELLIALGSGARIFAVFTEPTVSDPTFQVPVREFVPGGSVVYYSDTSEIEAAIDAVKTLYL